MGSVFGGSNKNKTSSESTRDVGAYPWIQETYTPLAEQLAGGAGGTYSLLQQLLTGTGGQDAYNTFLQSSGYQNVLDNAMKGITGSAAARGSLQSGSTLRALQGNAANLGRQYFSDYLNQLAGLSSGQLQGSQALGSLIGGMSPITTTGSGSSRGGSNNGLGGIIGGGLSTIGGML